MRATTMNILAAYLAIMSTGVLAQGLSEHSSEAVHHSATAITHSVAASAQLVSATAAVPFAMGAGLGALSEQISKPLQDAAGVDFHTPLEISEEVPSRYPSPAEHLNGNSEP